VTPAIVGVAGLKQYCDVMWEGLDRTPDVEVLPFAAGRGPALLRPARRLPVPLKALHLAWRLTSWPRAEGLVGPVDVVHSLDLMPPPTRRPLVVTVHDVIWLTHPELVSPKNRAAQRVHLEGARRAAAVVTSCASTADEIARVGGIPRERIEVTPFGYRVETAPSSKPPLEGPYVLSVGALEPRKGVNVLAQAVEAIPGCPPVVIVGPDGWRAGEVRRQVLSAQRNAEVHFLGPVSPEQLAAYYRHATVVCQPSLAEGFCLPVLEAMAHGAAVVASDLAPIREVGGDAVVLVPPGDVGALTDELTELLSDESRRRDLGERARRRAQPCTWERTTEQLVAVYRRVAGE
jgi:glycosyltransferase involved in cell wall biosynthesis